MNFENIAKQSTYLAGKEFLMKHLPFVMGSIPEGRHLRFEILPLELNLHLNRFSQYGLSMTGKENAEHIALRMVLLAGLRVEEMRRMHPVYRVEYEELISQEVIPVVTRTDNGLQAVELIMSADGREKLRSRFQEMQRRSGVVARCI